jgi:hypothetical protein
MDATLQSIMEQLSAISAGQEQLKNEISAEKSELRSEISGLSTDLINKISGRRRGDVEEKPVKPFVPQRRRQSKNESKQV